jgi:hypothetical protein
LAHCSGVEFARPACLQESGVISDDEFANLKVKVVDRTRSRLLRSRESAERQGA